MERRSGGKRHDSRGGYGNRNFEQREMHKANCDECKKQCEVPFKPTKGKPVFCRDCYKKKQGY